MVQLNIDVTQLLTIIGLIAIAGVLFMQYLEHQQMKKVISVMGRALHELLEKYEKQNTSRNT